MNESVFIETEFVLLIVVSLVLPASIYGYMMWRKAISRARVMMFGFSLIAVSGVTVFLLQRLAEMAKVSPSMFDDRVFASELSVTLYVLPILFGGIGVNMVSHILMSHLVDAEARFDRSLKPTVTVASLD